MMETNRTMTNGFLYAVCLNCVCVALLFLLHERHEKIPTIKDQTKPHKAPLKIRWVKTTPPPALLITPPSQEKKISMAPQPQLMPIESKKPLPPESHPTTRVVKKTVVRTPRRRRQKATRPLSLQDIANGFLNKPNAYAVKDTLKAHGHITGKQSAEQIQFHHYLEKSSSAINASLRSMWDKKPFIGKRNSQTVVEIVFRPEGTIASINIVESSGIPGLDSFILELFEETDNSFPPIPTYTKNKPLLIRYAITLSDSKETLVFEIRDF